MSGFSVILAADLGTPADPRPLAVRLAGGLNMDPALAARYASAMPCALWSQLTRAQAEQYQQFLRSLGVRAEIVADGTDPKSVLAPAPAPAPVEERPRTGWGFEPADKPSLRDSGQDKAWMRAQPSPQHAPQQGLYTLELPSLELAAAVPAPKPPVFTPPAPEPEALPIEALTPVAASANPACPKCGYPNPPAQVACAQCGVIFAKLKSAAPPVAPPPRKATVSDAISSSLKGFLKK